MVLIVPADVQCHRDRVNERAPVVRPADVRAVFLQRLNGGLQRGDFGAEVVDRWLLMGSSIVVYDVVSVGVDIILVHVLMVLYRLIADGVINHFVVTNVGTIVAIAIVVVHVVV